MRLKKNIIQACTFFHLKVKTTKRKRVLLFVKLHPSYVAHTFKAFVRERYRYQDKHQSPSHASCMKL